ncbi:MAG: glucokinase [Pseudomonadota bacterium]
MTLLTSTYTLLADVGGTHTRCAVGTEKGLLAIEAFDNDRFDSLEALLHRYVARQKAQHGEVEEVILGVAGPVNGDRVDMLNRDWHFMASDISHAVGARQTRLINDFEALAYSLSMLPSDDVVQNGGNPTPSPYATKAVLGAGTGLGVSSAVWTGSRWLAVPGEGGHVTLAANTEQEEALCRYLRDKYGHASAERALSGAGLQNVYHFISKKEASPSAISELAKAGDAEALEVFALFFNLLANVGANLALTLGASGGVYVGGGIVKKNQGLLNHQAFRTRFENKGRYRHYLAKIPVYYIYSDTPALLGLYYLRQQARIELPLSD